MARPRTVPKLVKAADKTEIDEVPLDENTALALQLAQSRLNEAQLAVQLRQGEMERVSAAVRMRFEEGGKFAVQGVDFQKMVVNRVEVAKNEGTSGQAD